MNKPHAKKNETNSQRLGQPTEKQCSIDIHEIAARLFVRHLDGSKTPEHVAVQAYKVATYFIEESNKH